MERDSSFFHEQAQVSSFVDKVPDFTSNNGDLQSVQYQSVEEEKKGPELEVIRESSIEKDFSQTKVTGGNQTKREDLSKAVASVSQPKCEEPKKFISETMPVLKETPWPDVTSSKAEPKR